MDEYEAAIKVIEIAAYRVRRSIAENRRTLGLRLPLPDGPANALSFELGIADLSA